MNLPTIFLLLMVGVVGLSFNVSADETTTKANTPPPTSTTPKTSPTTTTAAPTSTLKPITSKPTTLQPTTPQPTPKPEPGKQYNYMFDFASRGFDVRTQTLHNIIKEPKTWKKRIFKYMEDKEWQNKTWFDTDSKTNYTYPSFVEHAKNLVHAFQTPVGIVFDNFEDLKPLLSPNDLTVHIPGTFRSQTKQTTLMNVLAAETLSWKSLANIDTDSTATANEEFRGKAYVLRDKKFVDSQDKYKQFFDEFGTHFIKSVEFGGILRLKNEINATYYHVNQNRNSTLMKAYILHHMAHTLGISKNDAPEHFLNHSIIETYFVGGVPKDKNNIKAWIDSISSNRMPVKVNLEPLYNHASVIDALGNKINEFTLAFNTTMLAYEMEQGRDIHWDFNTSPNKFGRDRQNFPKNMAEYFQEYLTQMKEGYPWRNATYVGGCYPRMRMNVNYFAKLRDNIKVR